MRRFHPGKELAELLSILGAEYYGEDFEQSYDWAVEIIAIGSEINLSVSLAVGYVALSSAALWQGEYDVAHRQAEQALRVALRANDRYEESWSLWALTNVAVRRKDYTAAAGYAKQIILASQSIGYQRGILNGYNHLADIAGAQGEYEQSENYYRTCLSMANDLGNRFWEAQILCGLAKIYREQGKYSTAWDYFCKALKLARVTNSQLNKLEALTGIAELFARSGHTSRAIELCALILNSSFAFAVNSVTAGVVIRERVAALKDSLSNKLDAGDYADATQRGAGLELDAAVTDLLNNFEFSAPAIASFGLTPYSTLNQGLVDPLSERELEILQLLAAGLSNDQIANQLFLSVGTVKWYNTVIYGKLSVRSRTQAVARANELNLLQ